MFGKKNRKPENILILGLGGVGLYLAKRLTNEGYSITAIERDPDLLGRASDLSEVRLIKGDAMSVPCWREAEPETMDFMIAVTDNDAVNMVSSLMADRFGIKSRIARVRSLEFGNGDSILGAKDLKIDLTIHPEELASQEIVRLIRRTAGNEIIDIAHGQLQALATRIDETSPLANKRLREISETYKHLPFRVVSIARGLKTIIPSGNHEILPQDQVLFMAAKEDLSLLMEMIGIKRHKSRGVMILGGGLVGSRVAELLGKTVDVKLIESNYNRAEELSIRLDKSSILYGNGIDENILKESGIEDVDIFVAATGENQINIMSCLLAKNMMKNRSADMWRKTIAMVDKEDYLVLAATVGTDIALNKKILAGNEIIKFIRRGGLLSMAHVHGFDTEVIELVAAANAPITRAPLSKLVLSSQEEILIGAVFRNGKWETAVGSTHIRKNDRVIAICESHHVRNVRELFAV